MPARIVINPVVMEDGARRPLVATLTDPGRPVSEGVDEEGNSYSIPKALVHVSAISSGLPGERNGDALSIVAGADLSELDALGDQVTTLFEAGSDKPLAELRDWLTSTPQELGWNSAKRNRIVNRLTAVGADITGITAQTPLWQIVNRLGAVWMPGFDVREVRTMAPGAEAVAVIASDTFTVASDTTLASHVPDVGTSWVQEVLISTTSTMTCIAASDTLAGSVLDGDAGGVYTVRPSPSIATYDQQFTVKNLGTNAATPWWLIARYTDTSNYYGAGTFIGTNAADKKMYKMVAGTATELGSADTGLAANDVIKFEVRDGTKKLFQNGGEVFSTSDNSLTSAGSGGLGTGAAFVSSDDFPGTGGLRIDDYSLDEVSTGVSGTVGGVAEITGTSAGSPVAAGSVAGTVDVTGAATGTPVITGTSANDVAITSSITGGQGQAGTVAVTADIVSVITGAPVITGSVGAQTDIICLAAGPGGPGEEVPAGVLFQRPLLATVGRMMGI